MSYHKDKDDKAVDKELLFEITFDKELGAR